MTIIHFPPPHFLLIALVWILGHSMFICNPLPLLVEGNLWYRACWKLLRQGRQNFENLSDANFKGANKKKLGCQDLSLHRAGANKKWNVPFFYFQKEINGPHRYTKSFYNHIYCTCISNAMPDEKQIRRKIPQPVFFNNEDMT